MAWGNPTERRGRGGGGDQEATPGTGTPLAGHWNLLSSGRGVSLAGTRGGVTSVGGAAGPCEGLATGHWPGSEVQRLGAQGEGLGVVNMGLLGSSPPLASESRGGCAVALELLPEAPSTLPHLPAPSCLRPMGPPFVHVCCLLCSVPGLGGLARFIPHLLLICVLCSGPPQL